MIGSFTFDALMQPQPVKKIVVIGPESTGKSTLCQQLANHYQTLWCPEYAREYLLKHGMNYSYDDLLAISKAQLNQEDHFEFLAKNLQSEIIKPIIDNNDDLSQQIRSSKPPTSNFQLLFIDTDMYVMKVWCEFVFGKCHPFIIDQIAKRKYDLYLLCNVDLPWIKDALREYPDLKTRERLYHLYKNIMINQPVPWIDIGGNYEERLQKAVEAVNKIL